MPKKREPSEQDIALFQSAVKGTKPLAHKKIRITPPIRQPKSVKKPFISDDPLNLKETQALSPVRGEEGLAYKQTGVPDRVLRKLAKGQFAIDAKLDLHGMTIENAHAAIDDFLQQCRHNTVRVALIIHGKGQHSETPVLKNKINHWLRELHIVLAFCSAAQKHGGRGAVYVLLRI